MRLLIILLALFSVLFPIYAETDSFVIPLSSPIYEEIDTLYITQGLSSPSSNRPWSLGESEKILSRLDKDKLDSEEKKILESIENEMKGLMRWNDGDSFSFSLGLDTSLESYIHTNNEDFFVLQTIKCAERIFPTKHVGRQFEILHFVTPPVLMGVQGTVPCTPTIRNFYNRLLNLISSVEECLQLLRVV